MAVVTWRLGVDALGGWRSVALALVALALLRWRVNSAWLVTRAAVVSLLLGAGNRDSPRGRRLRPW
jgi:hypothetical protein